MKSLTKGKLIKATGGVSALQGKNSVAAKTAPVTTVTVFECSIKRAENLLQIHARVHGGGRSRPEQHLSDLLRASVVLAVSALDAYVRSLVAEGVLAKIKDTRKSLSEEMRGKVRDWFSNDELLDAAHKCEFLPRVERALQKNMAFESFQGIDKIADAMLLIGYKDIFKSIASVTRSNEQGLKDKLGRFTKRRHEIVHCGDHSMTQVPPKVNTITKAYAKECIKVVRRVAAGLGAIIK